MQALLVSLKETIDVMWDVATEHGIERVEFMGNYLHFGTDFGYGNWDSFSNRFVKTEDGFEAAVGGPVLNDEYWSQSSYGCWIDDKARAWMWGPDPAKWRKTSYDED